VPDGCNIATGTTQLFQLGYEVSPEGATAGEHRIAGIDFAEAPNRRFKIGAPATFSRDSQF